MPNVHIGNMVRDELERQGKTVTWLAEQLNMQRPNCYRLLRSQSMNTDMLRLLSILLEHNFFAECVNGHTSLEEPIEATTGVGIMEEFERKVLNKRMEIIEEDDCFKRYYFFYEYGFVECYASADSSLISISVRCIDELPFTPDLYAAALHICNWFNRDDETLHHYIVSYDEKKGKIYFDIKYCSYGYSTIQMIESDIADLFYRVGWVQKSVEHLREQVQQDGSFSLESYLYQKLKK